MPWPAVAAGAALALVGAAAERLASVWPPDEARHRPIGWRTLGLPVLAGLAGAGVAWRAALPAWALLVHLLILALLTVLVATDLEQRRLPHLVLDPLIGAAIVFSVVNPALPARDALIGAGVAVAFLGTLTLVIRGGLALGDLYLAAPLGLILGWPAVFSGLLVAALLAGAASLLLLATRRAGMRTYIAFGPYLAAGYVITLIVQPSLLGH